MSSKFDFSSYYEDLGKEENTSSDFSSYYSSLKPTSKLEKAGRLAAQYGIGAAELAAFPYELAVTPLKSKSAQTGEYRKNVFEDIERLQEQKQTGVWDEQDEQLLSSLINQVKNPKEMEKFVKTADVGVGDLAEKASKKLFDYDLAPEGLGEHGARILGNLISPVGIAKGVAKLPTIGKGLINKEFRNAIKEQKNWERLAVAAKGNPERETLLKFAQDHKLSPEATSLLYHSEGKAEYLARFGKRTRKYKAAVQELKGKLGQNYEELKALGKDGGYLNVEEAEKLTGNLGSLLEEMKSTHVIGPEAAPVINTIEKAVESVMNKPSTVKELINSRINLSDSINWKNIERGDFYRSEARKIFADAISEKNPAIGKRLLDTDRAWSKYENFKDVLDKKIPVYNFHGITLPQWMVEGIAFLGAPAYFGGIGFGAETFIAKELIKRIMTKLAINPKFQKPLKVWQDQILRGSTAGQKQAFLVIKNLAKKEDPELYEDLKEIDVD